MVVTGMMTEIVAREHSLGVHGGPVIVRSSFVQGETAQVCREVVCVATWMTRSNKLENAVEPRCEQAGGGKAESE
jgi:hypothetical protein